MRLVGGGMTTPGSAVSPSTGPPLVGPRHQNIHKRDITVSIRGRRAPVGAGDSVRRIRRTVCDQVGYPDFLHNQKANKLAIKESTHGLSKRLSGWWLEKTRTTLASRKYASRPFQWVKSSRKVRYSTLQCGTTSSFVMLPSSVFGLGVLPVENCPKTPPNKCTSSIMWAPNLSRPSPPDSRDMGVPLVQGPDIVVATFNVRKF